MKILQITPYPIVNPTHGGQIRSSEIKKFLENSGHYVDSLVVFENSGGMDHESNDIVFDKKSEYWNLDIPEAMDYLLGVFAHKTQSVLNTVKKRINKFKPDIVIVEQPWLFAMTKKIIVDNRVQIIYSSQNIEMNMKRDVLLSYPVSTVDNIMEKISDVENQAIFESDAIICCTKSDKLFYEKKLGNVQKPIIVAGNGVEPFSYCSDNDMKKWTDVIKNAYPVFVGSAHKPNSVGFWEMFYPGLTFLSCEEEVVVVGGVSDILFNDKKFKYFDCLNRSRLHLMGRRPRKDLEAIIKASHLIVLPITQGGGSNLKTAEALVSGRPIVATSTAFRGYEEAMSYEGVYIEDNPSKFRRKVRELLDNARAMDLRTEEQNSNYYWKETLKPILSLFATLEENLILKQRK